METKKIENENQTDTWNNFIEKVVREMGEQANAYKMMHTYEAQKSDVIYKKLMIMGIMLGPMAGLTATIGASLDMSNYAPIVILEVMFGFISGIVVSIMKFGKYDEVSNSNKIAAAKYFSLEYNIRRQLSLYRKDRILAKSYMEWLEIKYNEIQNSAPLLNQNNFNNYKITAQKNGWQIPNQYNEKIIVNTEDQDRDNKVTNLLEVNYCSDKMLDYELKRMMNV